MTADIPVAILLKPGEKMRPLDLDALAAGATYRAGTERPSERSVHYPEGRPREEDRHPIDNP